MPLGDRTGPMGMGPITGRGAGYCGGFGQPGFANPMPGRGWFGWGRAYGYPYAYLGYGYPYYGGGGWGNLPYAWPWASPSSGEETTMLENQAQMLERELKSIRRRIGESKK